MTRVYSFGCQLPGLFGFACPHCNFMFNLVNDDGLDEANCPCPKCKTGLLLVFNVDPEDDAELRSDLKRVKSKASGSGMQVYECPHCGSNAVCEEDGSESYVYSCIRCHGDYIREPC